MKHGTIVRNMWQPSYKSYFVYMGTSGQYAKGLSVVDTCDGDDVHVNYGIHYYKDHILKDREHYPIVGYIDLKRVVVNTVLEGLFK